VKETPKAESERIETKAPTTIWALPPVGADAIISPFQGPKQVNDQD
jgi:hypothetical protein